MRGTRLESVQEGDMKALLWVAVALMIVGAVMLVAGIGASVIWFSNIAVGLALVVIYRARGGTPAGR
jgi:uncharacterized membrane-anchored protein